MRSPARRSRRRSRGSSSTSTRSAGRSTRPALDGYAGIENVRGHDEEPQAAVYARARRAAPTCDPDIAQVNVFGFRDDPLRAGFQAGLHRADGTPRPVGRGGAATRSRQPRARATRGGAKPARAVVGAATPRPRGSRAAVARPAHRRGGGDGTRLPARRARHTLSTARRVLARRAAPRGVVRDGCRAGEPDDDRPHLARRTARDARRPARRRGECRPRDDRRAADSLKSSAYVCRISGNSGLRCGLDSEHVFCHHGTDVRILASRSPPPRRRRGAPPLGALRRRDRRERPGAAVPRPSRATRSGRSPSARSRATRVRASGSCASATT